MSLESARRKFFMNSTHIIVRNQTFLGSGGQMSLTAICSLESANEESNVFGLRRTNSHQLARIGENKIFHELDAHHC